MQHKQKKHKEVWYVNKILLKYIKSSFWFNLCWACVCTSVRWLNIENWVRTKCKEDLLALWSHPFTVETPSFIHSLITPKMRRTGKRESFKTQLHIQHQRSVVHVFGLWPLNTKKWLLATPLSEVTYCTSVA